MTLLAFLTTLIAGLLIGFCAGAWAATGFKVRKRQPEPLGEPSPVGDVGPADLPYWIGDRT